MKRMLIVCELKSKDPRYAQMTKLLNRGCSSVSEIGEGMWLVDVHLRAITLASLLSGLLDDENLVVTTLAVDQDHLSGYLPEAVWKDLGYQSDKICDHTKRRESPSPIKERLLEIASNGKTDAEIERDVKEILKVG